MAATSDGLIGIDDRLPWYNAEDLKFFEKQTLGHYMIMGRKTYESLPRRLFQERKSIVFSQSMDDLKINGKIVRSLDEFLNLLSGLNGEKLFMIGGSQIAHLFLSNNLISSFFLTIIQGQYVGNVYLNLEYFNNCREKIICQSSEFFRTYYSFD